MKPTEFTKPETAPIPKSDKPKLDVPQVPLSGTPIVEDAKIPPLTPRLSNPDVPPLTIPKIPIEPTTKGDKTTSKASPLTGAPRVDVYPVNGPSIGLNAKRIVGFFNHTDRDLKLTVEGDTIVLPRRHYVAAEVSATFAWMLEGDERRTEIPATAPGIEVVIRK